MQCSQCYYYYFNHHHHHHQLHRTSQHLSAVKPSPTLHCWWGYAQSGKANSSYPLRSRCHVLRFCVLHDKLVTVLLCAPLKMLLVKPILARYFRKLVVTNPPVEMTKGYTDMLLCFQNFFIYRAKFS